MFSENRNKKCLRTRYQCAVSWACPTSPFSFSTQTFEFWGILLVTLGLLLSSGYGEIFDGFMWKIQAL